MGLVGRPSHSIWLSINCFEQITLISGIRKTSDNKEKIIQRMIMSQLGGKPEVITPAGKIDLLTDSELIEIKEAKKWKEAIGQVLVYGHYYPSHQKRIHLIGHVHSSIKLVIEKHCSKLKIVVTWE